MEYFRYRHTNCYFIQSSLTGNLLAVDAGWPCTFHEYRRGLKSLGHSFDQVRWAIVTHFHMDHAGLLGEFLECGITCFIFENQIGTIDEMERTIRKNPNEYKDYRAIDQDKLVRAASGESRNLFREIGIEGEAIITTGHSPDSITVITDSHEAAIGDLPPIDQFMPGDRNCAESWELIKSRGAKHIFPSHAGPFEI